MVLWRKQNIMLFVLNFKKGIAHIHLHGYSLHQILKMKLPTYSSLRKQLLDHLNDPEFLELVKTYQVHAHSRTCWNTTRMPIILWSFLAMRKSKRF